MTPLAPLLAERIRRFGPITFAEYTRECLYHPVHGYYSHPQARRFSDDYTHVDVHPILADCSPANSPRCGSNSIVPAYSC